MPSDRCAPVLPGVFRQAMPALVKRIPPNREAAGRHAGYEEMCRKMAEFQTLTGGNPAKANPKLTALHVEFAQVEAEIEKLLNTLTGANAVLISYANGKIEELDAKRQSLAKAIAGMSAEAVSPEQMKRISGYLG